MRHCSHVSCAKGGVDGGVVLGFALRANVGRVDGRGFYPTLRPQDRGPKNGAPMMRSGREGGAPGREYGFAWTGEGSTPPFDRKERGSKNGAPMLGWKAEGWGTRHPPYYRATRTTTAPDVALPTMSAFKVKPFTEGV